MTGDPLIAHRWHQGHSVFFVLDRALSWTDFSQLTERAGELTQTSVANEAMRAHWDALQERLSGSSWDQIVPPYSGPADSPDAFVETAQRVQTVRNLVAHRPFLRFSMEGWLFTIDVFNPRNELQLDYPNAGEPVMLLLLNHESRDPRKRPPPLAEVRQFISLLESCANALSPTAICGTFSLFSVSKALGDGRLWRRPSPWSPLHPLTVIADPGDEVVGELRTFCSVVRPWRNGDVLLQVMPDLEAGVLPQYARAAKLVGRQPWTLYLDGGDSSSWPVEPDVNGAVPAVNEIVKSGAPELVRQALYQVQAAAMLKGKGYIIESFQTPVVTESVRISVPIVVTTPSGERALIYTEAGDWEKSTLGALKSWVKTLRTVSTFSIYVVANARPETIESLPDVKSIEFEYDVQHQVGDDENRQR